VRELRLACRRHDAELRVLIAKAAESGASSQAIADALGVSRATFWRRYGDVVRRTGTARARTTSEPDLER
jgi:AcrR family transcriptional regulator